MKYINTEDGETLHIIGLTKHECQMFTSIFSQLTIGGISFPCDTYMGFNLNDYVKQFDRLVNIGEKECSK